MAKISGEYKFLQGNEACVEAAMISGIKVFAGYPITPSTEIADGLSQRLPKVGGKFIQMEDEIASMGTVLGASLAGAKVMTATSGPGFSLKQELIGFACFCEIPSVIVVVQRGGPSTGLPTFPAQGDVMQAKWGTHGDHSIVVLCPSSVQEMFDLTVEAFNIAEKYRTPVILLPDEVTAHMRERVFVKAKDDINVINRKQPTGDPKKYKPYHIEKGSYVPVIADYGKGYRFNTTGLFHDETGFPTSDPVKVESLVNRLRDKIEKNTKDITFYDEIETNDADIIMVSYGSTARSATEAAILARKAGIKAGCIKLKTLWPFPEDILIKHMSGTKKIIVCEMNLGQLLGEIKKIADNKNQVFGVNIMNGQLIRPETILAKIKEVSR